jgi:hypothetical protein
VSTPFGQPPLEPLDPALVAETLAALSERLAAQEDLLTAVLDRLDAEHAPGGRWAWRHLTGAQAEALLAELTDWVGWLIERYSLSASRYQIPPCWADHPIAVEELTALMIAWKAAYAGPSTAPREDLIAWHDRWLWPCLTRLNEHLQVWNACRAGAHRSPVPDSRSVSTRPGQGRR